jgi:hypothetical protein
LKFTEFPDHVSRDYGDAEENLIGLKLAGTETTHALKFCRQQIKPIPDSKYSRLRKMIHIMLDMP